MYGRRRDCTHKQLFMRSLLCVLILLVLLLAHMEPTFSKHDICQALCQLTSMRALAHSGLMARLAHYCSCVHWKLCCDLFSLYKLHNILVILNDLCKKSVNKRSEYFWCNSVMCCSKNQLSRRLGVCWSLWRNLIWFCDL